MHANKTLTALDKVLEVASLLFGNKEPTVIVQKEGGVVGFDVCRAKDTWICCEEGLNVVSFGNLDNCPTGW